MSHIPVAFCVVGALVVLYVVAATFFPADTAPMAFLGAVFLCGIADPFSFYLADQAFHGGPYASIAKLGALVGSGLATLFGATALALSAAPVTDARVPLHR